MKEIMERQYMTAKEASARYGYSMSWFGWRRHRKMGPPYVKMVNKIYYEKDMTDVWFRSNMRAMEAP